MASHNQNHYDENDVYTPTTPLSVLLRNPLSRDEANTSERPGMQGRQRGTNANTSNTIGTKSADSKGGHSFRNAISNAASRASKLARNQSSRRSEQPTIAERRPHVSTMQQQATERSVPGWTEEGYQTENPWFGKAGQKPVFSLGKPLPHLIRNRSKMPQPPLQRMDEEMGLSAAVIQEEPSFDRQIDKRSIPGNLSLRPEQTRAGSAAMSARQVQDEQDRTTAAGVGHSERKNAAGQPVFDYIPSRTGSSQTRKDTTLSKSDWQYQDLSSTEHDNSQPDFKIDGEPLGQTERSEVEDENRDPNAFRNWWARLRSRHPEPLAEFLATGVAIFLGLAGTLSVNLSSNQDVKYGEYETSCWSWGFAWMFGIYLGGGVSGAHMNPAISISLSIFRGFPWRQCLVYVVVQFIASIVAGALAYGIYADSIHHSDPSMKDMSATFFSTPREWVSPGSAFFNQVVGSAVMMIAVFALGDDQNNPPGAGMHALVLGFLVTTLKFTLGYNIGSALNPASDFGPRVIAYAVGYREHNVFGSGWWFYGPWLATMIGSIIGCALYDGCIFVGSESPINYRFKENLKRKTKNLLS